NHGSCYCEQQSVLQCAPGTRVFEGFYERTESKPFAGPREAKDGCGCPRSEKENQRDDEDRRNSRRGVGLVSRWSWNASNELLSHLLLLRDKIMRKPIETIMMSIIQVTIAAARLGFNKTFPLMRKPITIGTKFSEPPASA